MPLPYRAICAIGALTICYVTYMVAGPGGDGILLASLAAAFGAYMGVKVKEHLNGDA